MSPSERATWTGGGDLESQAVGARWLLGFTPYFFQAGVGDLPPSISPLWHQHCRMLEGGGLHPSLGHLYEDRSKFLTPTWAVRMGIKPVQSSAPALASWVGFWAVMGFLQQCSCCSTQSSATYLLHPLAAKAPHFSRLGDVEVNAGQNATFQCVAAGKAAEAERFLMQVSSSGGETSISAVKPTHHFCSALVPALWEKALLGSEGEGSPPTF